MPATRRLLASLFEGAVEAARGERILRAHSAVRDGAWHYAGPGEPLTVPLPGKPGEGRVLVAGAGKAAASLARGLEQVLGDRIDDGVVIVKHGHREHLGRIRVLEASHPTPDQSSLDATHDLLRTLQGAAEADTIFFVLSGGASALLMKPAAGLSLQALRATDRLLVNSGAAIEEINIVRKHVSAVSGGRLRQHARCAAFCTLAISDVIGDRIATIGSGPTVPDPSTFADAIAVVERYGLRAALPPAVVDHLLHGVRALNAETPKQESMPLARSSFRIVASNRISLETCARRAHELGYRVELLSAQMHGHTHDAAHRFAAALREAGQRARATGTSAVVLAGGETTLAVEGGGRGGRNQEFALIAALDLQGITNVALLSAGTDGTDGPTDAAGAFADGSTIARARALGLDVEDHLRRHDVHTLWGALGDLHHTGPTGTNVMDLVIGVAH